MTRLVDPAALSARLERFLPHINEASGWVERHAFFDGPPHGTATVSFSPRTRAGQVCAENHNRINLQGGADLTRAGFAELCDLLRGDGAETFFVGLMPGPDMERGRAVIEQAGFVRDSWVRAPVLVRAAEVECLPPNTLHVRETDADEARALTDALGETMWASFLTSADKPGFHHFLAFDGVRPVAHAALAMSDEGLAYLGWMSTALTDRGRGAQQALIAARIAKARSLGADMIVSETLSILKTSLGNLQRAGFREAYEREVYGLPQP